MRTKEVPETASEDLHSTVVRFSDSTRKHPINPAPRKKAGKDKPVRKNKSIFVSEPRSHKEVVSDVIWADCMNHGYKLEKSIGEGAYAKVKLAEVLPAKLARNQTLAEIAEETGVLQVAVKVIDNRQVPKEFLKKFLPRELSNHVPLEPHKNVVRVFEQFRTTERVYVVMEYCSNGDLLDLINQQISEDHRGLGEDRSRAMFKQVCEGVQHIHNNGIAHRDLKCENILIDDNYDIKVTDFGFSTKYNDKSAMLRTSCGSYAYTAPEVIKSKPYDGFKSDTWSLGIILFAMLNGRLPFNDSQLMEMEEDMKMQRLRFERTVSFEAMVVVRRILQYNPTQRPMVQEILIDPWLTGNKMIPRQTNRPKWINPYEARMEESKVTDSTLGANPVYYKATVPERGQDATVTVKHEGNETVVLKSRTGPKKNIWTSGPTSVGQNRPNTWPKSEKERELTRHQNRASRGPRAYPRNKSANTTVIVKTLPKSNRKDSNPGNEPRARVSAKTMHLSKWFMDKYMKKTKDVEDSCKTADSNCDHCLIEAGLEKMSALTKNVEKTAAALGKQAKLGEACKARAKNSTEDDYIKLEDGLKLNNEYSNDIESEQSHKIGIRIETKTGGTRYEDSSRWQSSFKSSAESCGRVCSPENTRKTLAKSANARKSATGSNPTTSKSLDLSKKCLLNHMVNKSTSPAERVKYFRQRLMRLYGNDACYMDKEGLPPLMVQAIRPPPSAAKKDAPAKTSTVKSASTAGRVWKSAGTRAKSENGRTKPIQRVVVHSAL